MGQDQSRKNKDIENLDITALAAELLSPIDLIRSQTRKEGFLESRCNAFYRMIGFPVVSKSGSFFSPGYNVNANMSEVEINRQVDIIEEIIRDRSLTSQQLDPRERIFKTFRSIFSDGGFNAITVALGSVYVRSFDNQFGSTDPLVFDSAQVQSVSQRDFELFDYYNYQGSDEIINSFNKLRGGGFLLSTHILKPFIVDPRISITPHNNLIAAPFLKDASQLTQFDGSSYQRPYIERVISIRFNNQNLTGKSPNIVDLISSIKDDNTVTDAYLISVANNPQKELQNSDVVVFGSYLKLMRALINTLIIAIKEVLDAEKTINFQPVPDTKLGLEGTITLNPIDPADPNNKAAELKILELFRKISLEKSSNITDVSTNGADEGGFVFSGLDDMVFASDKSAQISSQKEYDDLVGLRNHVGETSSGELQKIELIMGEFSGLGLIDIVAIQSAFWLMDKGKLLGLIDQSAHSRLLNSTNGSRPNLNVSTVDRNSDVLACLKEYESQLKQVYGVIQLYANEVWNGQAHNIKQ